MDKIKTDKPGRLRAPQRHTTYFLTADCPKSHSTTTVTKLSHCQDASSSVLKPSMSSESVDSFFFSDISVINKREVIERTPTPMRVALSVASSKPASLLSIDSGCSSPRLDGSDAVLSENLLSSDDESEAPQTRMPQFIMPTIPLTCRRPFTETGLHLGKLRMMVTGQTQSGKTTLIKSFVQQCQDIVFVDGVVPVVTSPFPPSRAARPFHEPPALWETQASTRPNPVFVLPTTGSVSDSSTITTTPSTDTSTLDLNLSFVECSSSSSDWLDHATCYLEQQLQKTSQMVNPVSPNCPKIMMTSSGFDNVDVCLFLVCRPPTPEDFEHMRVLASYVPLVPLISKSDTMTESQLASVKLQVLRGLSKCSVTPYSFDYSVSDILSLFDESDLLSSDDDTEEVTPQNPTLPVIRKSTTPQYPFAVSSMAELEVDASVLMNQNYTPQLVPSNLDVLCGHLFCEKGASWMRYKAGQQFIAWAVSKQQTVALRSIALGGSSEPTFVIPDYVVSPLTANKSMVDWISQLKTESGVLVKVTQTKGPVYNCLGEHFEGPPQYSHSISNVDPLQLRKHVKLLGKLIGWAAKALSYTLGASLIFKVVAMCIQGDLYAPPPPPPPSPPPKDTPFNDAAALLCRVCENISRELMAVAEFTF